MKLIIDIPDYDYKQIKEVYEKSDIVESTYSYIYHGKPLSEVLAEIKGEIDECYRQANDLAYAEGLEMADIIIDKHIEGDKE